MRIVFIGTVISSYQLLETILEKTKLEVAAIITKKSSSYNKDFVDLTPLAEKFSIPIHYIDPNQVSQTADIIKQTNPDICFCFGWSHLLDNETLSLPRLGTMGYHPSSLPENRGRHPIIWALVLGLSETASTFFMMDEGADSGDITSQKKVAIHYEDDAQSLYDKLMDVAKIQIVEIAQQLIAGTLKPKPQNHAKATYWRKRGAKDGLIDLRMTSREIYNLVRALTKPYGGADLSSDNKMYKIWKVREISTGITSDEPGKIIGMGNQGPIIKCGQDAIEVIESDLGSNFKKGDYL